MNVLPEARTRKAPSRRQLIRITKERWRTERVDEDVKGELGLDHYAGRSFRGWHQNAAAVAREHHEDQEHAERAVGTLKKSMAAMPSR